MDPRDLVRSDVRNMAGYTPGEQVTDCVKLNTNECAWPPTPSVAHAIANFVAGTAAGLRVYPSPRADAARAAAARRYGVPAEGVLVGNGSDDLLTILVRGVVAAGETIATPAPTYGLYDVIAELQGARMVTRPYGPAWELPADLGALGAKLVFISSPNNPSATLTPRAEILALAKALAREAIVVVDEAYADFAGETLIDAIAHHPNLVVLRTFSKSYALAGARLGLLFADPRLVSELMKVKDSYNVNALSQVVGVAALEDHEAHRALVDATLVERRFLEDTLTRMGFTFPPSAANFLLVDVGTRPVARRLYAELKARRILVRHFDRPRLDTSLRITVGTREQNTHLAAAMTEILGDAHKL